MNKESKILLKENNKIKIPTYLIILLTIYAIYCFAILYVKAITNNVVDPEIIKFVKFFDLAYLFTFIIWVAMTIFAVLTNKKTIQIIRLIALINIGVTILVSCLYMFPCMSGNIEIIGLKEKLLKLFLCPSYNQNSWVNILAVIGISLIILMSSSIGKRIIRRRELRKM